VAFDPLAISLMLAFFDAQVVGGQSLKAGIA
jgi:hypothetical protein